MLHLPGHHHFPNVFLFQDVDELPQLPDIDPMDGLGNPSDLRRCFAFDSNHHHVMAQAASRFKRQEWEAAVPRNEPVPLFTFLGHY